MCADIVIVGGGPIGCWTAIQIKKRNPALDVQIYERHPEYQRDHMMSIRRDSFMRYSKQTGDARETELFKKIALAHDNAAEREKSESLRKVVHIRTLDLEAILKEHCEQLGVGFTYQKINKPEEVMLLHPECSLFVAADGTHSRMRTALLGKDGVKKTPLQSSIDVKYDVRGQAEYLREPTFNKIDMIVVETVSDEKDGVSSVALRCLVDDKTFNAIGEATAKKPLSMKDVRFKVPEFHNEVRNFQGIRQHFTDEVRVPDSERVTKVKLSRYASKKFAVTADYGGRRAGWFMAGDAAMGMPFYRSINSGLMQGSQLGHILGTPSLSLGLKKNIYNAIRPFKLAREFGTVSAKLSGINAYRKAVRPTLIGLTVIGLSPIIIPVAAAVGLYMLVNPRARLM